MQLKHINYSVKNHVALITLNRPDVMNALTLITHNELGQAIDAAAKDDEVRVIVITGAGKGFCSGDDVNKVFVDPEENINLKEWRLRQLQGEYLQSGAHKLLQINKPSIAAVNGAAVGYGCDLALMCNMRVASEKAKFGEVFLRVGLIPDEATILLPRLVGLAKTYELILTTDLIDAKEAERIGLVNKVVPHDDLMVATMQLANQIADKPPIAVKMAIESIRRGLNLGLEEFMVHNAMAFDFCMETEDHIEGSRAFLEKRTPVFRGR